MDMSRNGNKLTATGCSDTQSPAGGEGSFGFGSVLALPPSSSDDRQSTGLAASPVADRKDIARQTNLYPLVKVIDVKKEGNFPSSSMRKKKRPTKDLAKKSEVSSDDTLVVNSDSSDSKMSTASIASSVLGKRTSSRRISSETEDEFIDKSLFMRSQKGKRKKKLATELPRDTSSDERRRGRPPTTGDYVNIAAAKQKAREEKQKEIELKIESEIVDDWALRARERKMTLVEITDEDTTSDANAAQLMQIVEKELAAIGKIASTSKKLKGTYVKLLRDAVSTIKTATNALSRRSLQEETRKLAKENERLEKEVESLKMELHATRNDLRDLAARVPPSSPLQEPSSLILEAEVEMGEPITAPISPLSNKTEGIETASKNPGGHVQELNKAFEEFSRTIMIQVGTMMSARFEALESRLLPDKLIRPPLAVGRSGKPNIEPEQPKNVHELDIKARRKTRNANAKIALASPETIESMKKKPIITENTALDQRLTIIRQMDTKRARSLSNGRKESTVWTTVTRSKKKGKKEVADQPKEVNKYDTPQFKTERAKRGQTQEQRTNRTRKEPKVLERNVNSKPRRRAPRTAAVAIRCKDSQCSYAKILTEARNKVSLTSLGIETSKVRKAASGGIIIEIPGADRTQKAENLLGKLQEVFHDRKEGEEVIVSRPIIKGEIRIIGLDDSVDNAEIRRVVAENGNCKTEEMRVSQIRTMTNGMGLAWVQCPLATAIRLGNLKKLRIGWSTAKVELLRTRPTQCFKCWEYGHTMAACSSTEDRSSRCYKCGETGHRVAQCQNNPHCLLCASQKKESAHRLGSGQCSANKVPGKILKRQPTNRAVTVAVTTTEDPVRRTETMMEVDHGN